jgi:hypothetical protein
VTIRRGGTLTEADHQLLALIQRQLGHSNLGITSVLPAGHRQRRDHRDRPRPAPADDSQSTHPHRAERIWRNAARRAERQPSRHYVGVWAPRPVASSHRLLSNLMRTRPGSEPGADERRA